MQFLGRSFAVLAASLGIFATSLVYAASPETRSTSHRASLSKLVDTANAPTGRYGYVLMDANTGEVLDGRNADDLFIPASLAKIPTTLSALAALGADHRFETKVTAEGTIVDGVLKGDLHLVGSGDPSLTARDMRALASSLAESGLRRVDGRFIFDASALPRTKQIDASQSGRNYYNPAVGGLIVDHNLRVKNGQRFTVRNPGHRAAMMLRYFANDHGVTLPKPIQAPGNADGRTVAVHLSAPLSQIVAKMMERSTNLTAEALGALSVRSIGSRPKSLFDAAKATTAWLKSQAGSIGGAGWAGFRMENHSGLSTRSRATPRQMASILMLGYQKFGTEFTKLHKPTAPGSYKAFTLRGKFGTMRFVRGYGGFLTVGGRDMVFTIMTNDNRRRKLADAGASGLRSAAWMNKARRLEQAILTDWVADHWSGSPVQYAAAETVEPVSMPVITTTIAQPILAPSATMEPIRSVGITSDAISENAAPMPGQRTQVAMQPTGDLLLAMAPITSEQSAPPVQFITDTSSMTVSFQDLQGTGSSLVRTTSLVE